MIPFTRRMLSLGLTALALSTALATLPAAVQAQGAFPNKPVRLVVPLTPGSGADIVARVLAKRLQEVWGQTVVIDNKPGAGGQIGTREVVRAPADGYTLLVQSASHAANPAIYKSLPYDPTRELADVAMLATAPYVLVTASAGPYKNVKDIVAAAKAQPQAVPFASAGVGSSTHLTAELFAQQAGVKLLHIPFKGSPDAINDVAAGRSAFYMAPLPTVAGMLKEGRVAAIAVTSPQRVASLPQVATVTEQQLTNFKAELWVGLWAPAATPPEVLAKLAKDVSDALRSADVQEQYARSGNVVRVMTPPDFAKFVREEIEANKVIVKAAGIQPE